MELEKPFILCLRELHIYPKDKATIVKKKKKEEDSIIFVAVATTGSGSISNL